MTRRVAVTGMAGVTALGEDWPTIRAAFESGKTGVRLMPEWDRYTSIHTRLAAPIPSFSVEDRYPRKQLRTMGKVAQLAVYASECALKDAGLLSDPVVRNGRTGIAYGSSFGTPDAILGFAELKTRGATNSLAAAGYIQLMNHTTAVNIGLVFGVTGRIVPTSSACTSGSQGIGYAYEAIRWGKADVMIAGGAEELDVTDSAVFDTLYATSVRNTEPVCSPRPYDRDRDGLVIGEGAATLILEEFGHARARGAHIYAELVGYGTNSDGNHVTQPQASTMAEAMRLALSDASLAPEAISFVNGHGTATQPGDIAESIATNAVLGPKAPVHSLKVHYGNSLGACGSIEAWLGIEMMRASWFCPTANLENVDERCAELDYVMGVPRRLNVEYLMSNNFGFGGINTSLIFRNL